MRIVRSQSRLSFRRRRRRSGCLSFVIFMGVLVGVGALSSQRIAVWLVAPRGDAANAALNADQRRAAARAFAIGDLNGAIESARAALSANPVDSGALAVLVRALIYRSYADYDGAIDQELALEAARDAYQLDPLDIDLQAVQAFALANIGDVAMGVDLAQRVLQHQPQNALARTAAGLAYTRAGNHALARRELEQAVTDSASYANGAFRLDALRALALAQSNLGDYAAAGATVEEALSLNNQILLLYFERALYALQIGNTDAATVNYYEVLAIDPDNVKARLRLCEVSSLLREHDQAVSYCLQVTERAPAWSEGWYRLGREYFLGSDFSAARDALHRCSSLQIMQAIPLRERRFECWYLQGQTDEILGDCTGLIATYNEYREMAASAQIQGSWEYPPEGPPMCIGH
ncbi:MAG: hypothetical protein U0670_18780 [Anaerolineae bacterium]